MLEKAKAGIYTQFEVQRGLPIQQLVKFFAQVGEAWQIAPEIRAMVQFRPLNLLNDFKPLGSFDVVFCRNVLIYFDQPTKIDVLNRLARQMPADGFLFLGAAETVVGLTDAFKPMADRRGLYLRNTLAAIPGQQLSSLRPRRSVSIQRFLMTRQCRPRRLITRALGLQRRRPRTQPCSSPVQVKSTTDERKSGRMLSPNKPIIAPAPLMPADAALSHAWLFGAADRRAVCRLHFAHLDPDLDASAAAAVGLRQSSGAHACDRDAAENPQLANFYEIDWQVIPNLTMDLIVPLLARVMNIYLAGQVFMVAMFALIISGTLALNRALDRPLVGDAAVRHSAAL